MRALVRIDEDAAFVGLAERGERGGDGQRLITELVAGVTRMRRWLDFVLGAYYRGDLRAAEPAVRAILRAGLYELRYLDTPDHAAVSEYVGIAKRLVREGAGGLVNGVLRATLRASETPMPETGDVAEDLAITRSYPTWLVRRWIETFGAEAADTFLAKGNERPVYGVRPNVLRETSEAFRARLDALGVGYEPSPWVDDVVRVRAMQALRPMLHAGEASVQDEGAALVVRLLAPAPGETVFDVCAAPGGKAILAAERMGDKGRIVASDAHAGRLSLVAKAAHAHWLTSIETLHADVDARVYSGETADAVLLDVPCSGTGVLAKRADLRWSRTPDGLAELVDLQAHLLAAASRLVRPGGRLVYATCSVEPEENERQVDRFLAGYADFRLERADGLVPPEMVTREGYYQALPHVHGTDGAFAARFVRARRRVPVKRGAEE